MTRNEIINTVKDSFLQSNIENDEWSYTQALAKAHKSIDNKLVTNPQTGNHYKNLDLRFADPKTKVAVLIETKQNFNRSFDAAKKQLQAYVEYEKVLSGYRIVAILANTKDGQVLTWRGRVSDETLQKDCTVLLSFEEYVDMLSPCKNDREEVMRNTYELNELMHQFGVKEKLRSQLVGTCLLALKSGVEFETLTTKQILAGIESTLESLLSESNDLHKAGKLAILNDKVLGAQSVRCLDKENLRTLMRFIRDKILPFINEKSSLGQDLLNLFFTIFNKYVGKADKNQAFTPDHIVHFMCRVVGITRNSKVLDPCCGSGAFLVRALTDALDDCKSKVERETVKRKHIFGIEFDENAFGLSTTNMLIHSDGNSNVIQGNCFENLDWIAEKGIDRVLMNPPYNAQRVHCQKEYVKNWSKTQKEDPSKGFHFVYEVAKAVKTGKLAVLLPMQCAIGSTSEIQRFKKLMLEEHTLDAVFSLPKDMFHPGASASACCMVFTLGTRHDKSTQGGTFFGYFKDDGFVKRKNLGRVEIIDKDSGIGLWQGIEDSWLKMYRSRKIVSGLSAVKKVTWRDEWLCEAYMETDYSKLKPEMFAQAVRDYLAYQIKMGG